MVNDEPTNKIDHLVAPLYTEYFRERCYLGLMCRQGGRQMIQINVPAQDLPTLLQARPSLGNDPDSGKNRPEIKGHAEEIKDYIIQRVHKNKPWILGTLTANVNPEDIQILDLGRGVCFVIIPRGHKLDITDGQHRKTAIHQLIESDLGKLIGEDDFPITLVLEENFNQCQTDFRDMAQARQLDKSLLVSFGEHSGRIGITKNLVNRVSMFYGKTEKVKKSPSTKQKLIYTNAYIVNLVSCAFTNQPDNDLEDYDVEMASHELTQCLNQFFSECPVTSHIANQSVDELTVEEVANFKEKYLLGFRVGLEILGRLLYMTYDGQQNEFNRSQISQLAQLDWSRESRLWENNVVTIDPNPKNPHKPYKISMGASQVRIAVNIVKTYLGWGSSHPYLS